MTLRCGFLPRAAALLALCLAAASADAQDLEPRRWTHLPTGVNVLGLGLSWEKADIFFDPVLEIEDATSEVAAGALVYLRTFGLFGRSARLDFYAPYAVGNWVGLLRGEPASVRRHGFADPRVRLSMLLYGGPAESRDVFMSSPKSDTVVGVAVSVQLPFGEYYGDRLINLGQNRWVIRPQLGITHTRGRWTGELTGSVFLFGDNDDFFGGSKLSNDPLWAMQAHLIYSFRPGLWLSASTAYGDGADAEIDGRDRALRSENWLSSLTVGVPVGKGQGLKLSWVRKRTRNVFNADSDSLVVAWTLMY